MPLPNLWIVLLDQELAVKASQDRNLMGSIPSLQIKKVALVAVKL